jgi:hypothetical protein
MLAGVSAAVASQPADVLLSKVCGGSMVVSECIILDGFSSFVDVVRSIGFKGCFTGLHARAIMIGTLTCAQFLIYEKVKKLLPSSSIVIKASS